MLQYDYTQHLLEVARLMELAARTAPKSLGQDFIEIKILTGREVRKLANHMVKFGKRKNKHNFDRDAKNIENSPVVMLMGHHKASTVGLDCGACGFNSCNELKSASHSQGDYDGPTCVFRHLDFGIALGSAAKTAQILNVDNRIMYRVGVAARDLKIVDWDIVMGLPLSASGKNIYFDRELKK